MKSRDADRLSRRGLLALPFFALAPACAAKVPPEAPTRPPLKLALSPLADLVKAPLLAWMLEISPRRAFEDDAILAAVAAVIPEERFRAFAGHNGHVDPRFLDELVVARYPDATLTLGKGTVDPTALHKAFEDRAVHVDGRAIDVASPEVVRLFGDGVKERMQLVTFGREGFGLETGRSSTPRGSSIRPSLPSEHRRSRALQSFSARTRQLAFSRRARSRANGKVRWGAYSARARAWASRSVRLAEAGAE